MDKKTKEDLNTLIKELLSSPGRIQEFIDIFSIDDNWKKVDKGITVPSGISVKSDECPHCGKTIRMTHAKFCTADSYYRIKCPHCKKKVGCHLEFTGYTCEAYLEEYDKEVHGN